jgi:hypothetical protein
MMMHTVRRQAVAAYSRSMSVSSGEITRKTRRSNTMVAGALLGFVGCVYYYTVNKINGKDELQMVIDQEIGKK